MLNLVFLLHSASALLFAFLLLFFAKPLATALGVPPGEMTHMAVDLAHLYAVCCVGIAAITWLGRTTASLPGRRAIVIAMLVLEGTGFVVGLTVHYSLVRALTVVFYLLFFLAYVYIWLFRPDDFMPVP